MGSKTDELLLKVKGVVEGQGDIKRLVTDVAAGIERVNGELKKQAAASREAEGASKRLSDSYEKQNNVVDKLTKRVLTFIGVQQAASRAFGVAKGIFEAGANMEKWDAAFGVLLGGADAAQKKLEYLTDFAAKTPFTLPQVIEASKLLEALGMKTEDYLGTLGNVSAFLDKDIKDAVLAISQAQRGELENLKSFGVDIQMIARRAGVDLFTSGRRSSADLKKLAAEVMEYWKERYTGGMDAISKTTSGRLSNISDDWFKFKARIAASGVGEVFRGQLQRLLDKIDELEKNGKLEKWAKGISDALASVLKSIETVVVNFNRLKDPILFLVGGIGLLKVAGYATLAAKAIAEWGLSMIAASGAAATLEAALAPLGGPLAVALFLLGGIAAISLAHAEDQVASLRQRYVELDEELAKSSRRPAGSAPDLKAVLEQADEATKALGRLKTARDFLDQESPIALIDRDQLLALDEATIKARGLADELARAKTGGIDREAPIAAPVGAVRAAREELGQTYGIKPGESFEDIRKRGAAMGTPPATEKAKAPDVDPEAGKKAAEAAKKKADAVIKEAERAEQETTKLYAEAVQRRLDLSGAEGQERVRLAARYGREEMERLLTSGEEYMRRRSELEREFDGRLADAKLAAVDERTRATLVKEIEADREAARQGLEIAFRTGHARAQLAKQFADDMKAAEATAAREAATKRTEAVLAEARYERDAHSLTTREYIAELNRRLQAFKADDAAYRALIKERIDYELRLERERAAAIEDIRSRNPRLSKDQAGDVADAKTQAEERARDLEEATRAYTEDATSMFDLFFDHVLGRWNEMFGVARAVMAGMSGIGAGFYNRMRFEAELWFKHHKTSQGLMLSILKSAAREGTAAMLDALATRARAQAKEYGARALAALGEALLFGNPGALAAAAKFGAAAAALGAAGAIASAGAASLRAQEQADQDRTRQSIENPASAGATGAAGAERGTPDARNIAVTAADRTIVQNFYLMTSFEGGIYFFGRDGGRELVAQLIPDLQEALNNGQLRVA